MARQGARTPDRARARFLDVLRESCNVSAAARAAGVNRRTPYKWREDDDEFAEAWEEAEATARDRLEEEAWRRAIDGYHEKIIKDENGNELEVIHKYSDKLMEILLKGHKPDRFTERKRFEHSGKMSWEQLVAKVEEDDEGE